MDRYAMHKIQELSKEVEVIHRNMKVIAIFLVITLFVAAIAALSTLILLLK